jgi:hypothetical protein
LLPMIRASCLAQLLCFGLTLAAFPRSSSASDRLRITVDPVTRFQTLDGFGASDAWQCDVVGKNWPTQKREQIADLLFSRDVDAKGNPKGIDLGFANEFDVYTTSSKSNLERNRQQASAIAVPGRSVATCVEVGGVKDSDTQGHAEPDRKKVEPGGCGMPTDAAATVPTGMTTNPHGFPVYDVTSFGAVGDGKTLNSAAVQAAVDRAAAVGGGTVFLAPGNYLAGTIRLRDHVTLYLASGCTIWGSTNLAHYDPDHKHLLFAHGVENVTIRGSHTLNTVSAWSDESRLRSPPCARTISRERFRPSPTPSTRSLREVSAQ